MSIRPITDTLRLLQGGVFLDECSELLAEVVRAGLGEVPLFMGECE